MPLFRVSRASRTAWLVAFIAAGCVYPRLSTSPDWKDDDAAGGDGSEAGSAGSQAQGGEGASSGSGGSAPVSGGQGAAGPVGGEGGAPPVQEDIIRATVVDQFDTPVPGVVVLIDDVELVSDAEGKVSLSDSGKTRFDVTVVDETNRVAYRYEGVTRRDVRLGLSLTQEDWRSATVSGTVQTSFNASNLRVFFDDRRRGYSSVGMRNAADTAPSVRYEMEPMWGGATTLNGQLSAMNHVADPVRNVAERYEFGSVPLALTDGDVKSNVNLQLTELATRELDVSVSVPAGVTRYDTLLFGNFAYTNTAPTSQETYLVPDDPAFDAADVPSYFNVSCTSPEGNSSLVVPLDSNTADVDAACGAPPVLVSPAPGAVGVKQDARFAFEPKLSGCHSFSITHQGSWSVVILTMHSETVAPDLTKYGLSYAAHDVSWTAGTTSPCDGIDTYVAPIDRAAPPPRLTYVVKADRSAGATFTTTD